MPLKVSENFNKLTKSNVYFRFSVRRLPNGRYFIRVIDHLKNNKVYEGNTSEIPIKYLFWIIYYRYNNIENISNNNIINIVNNNNLMNKINNLNNLNVRNRFRNLVNNRGGSITGTINSN